MTSRPRPTSFSWRARSFAAATLVLASLLAPTAKPLAAQLIQIKTLPIADGDQWRFFPSANQGLGGVSIALRDSLLDPFDNPAKGARLSERSKGIFFGSPTAYSVSQNAGGGMTLAARRHRPLRIDVRRIRRGDSGNRPGPDDAGFRLADRRRHSAGRHADVGADESLETESLRVRDARPHVRRAGMSVGASALVSGLNDVDGVDLLYAGSAGIDQHGGALDVRLAFLKEWAGQRSLEAIVLHDRFGMTHDVTWLDQVWDPNTRTIKSQARMDHNVDRTNTWGLHLAYSQPLTASGWRVGAIATTNLMSHPKLPDYQITQVMVIPWDPGHSAAYDLGVGIAKSSGLTTFGVDAIYEPIHTHTWGETPAPIVTDLRTIPAGGKTTENHFHFSNAILRTGIGQEIPIDTVRGTVKSIRLELGLAVRSIGYTLNQFDHVTQAARNDRQSWVEWTPTWGLGLRFSDLELRYNGRKTTGTGRPGILNRGDILVSAPAAAESGRNFLSAPSGPTTLTNVVVTTHQISVSVPIR